MQCGTFAESAVSVAESTVSIDTNVAHAGLISPSAKKMMVYNKIDEASVACSGRDGRVLKEDVVNYLSRQKTTDTPKAAVTVTDKEALINSGERIEKRVPMTRLRARIAERLLDAQQSAAILTTFNEVNMKPVKDWRKK